MNKTIYILEGVVLFICIVLFNFYTYIWGASTSGAALLKQFIGGRPSSMGESYVAISDDLYGLHYNPAGISNLKREFTCMYFQEPDIGFNYGLLGYGQKLINGVLAGSLLMYDAGKIEWEDESGNVSKLSVQRDYLYTVGYSRKIISGFSVGLNAKLFSSTMIEKYNATAYGMDIGGLYDTPVKGLTVGAVVQNIGTPIKYLETADPMPATFRTGSAYKMKLPQKTELTVAMDIVKPNDSDTKENVGIECWYNNLFALRGGYKIGYDLENYSFGIGFKWVAIQIEYGMISRKNLDFIHIVSVSLKEISPKSEVSRKDEEKLEEELLQKEKITKELLQKDRIKILISEIDSLCEKGMYLDALNKNNGLLEIDPTNNAGRQLGMQLERLVEIVPLNVESGKTNDLVRKSISSYLGRSGDERIALLSIRYAWQLEPENQVIQKLLKFIEQEYPGIAKKEQLIEGKTIVEQKLAQAVDCIYNAEYTQAIAECEDILTLEPDNVLALKRSGSAYYALGNKEIARKMWKQAQKLAPYDDELKEFIQKTR